ncbi:MAG: GAF domain-containing protein [Salibacteraceae bacterium]
MDHNRTTNKSRAYRRLSIRRLLQLIFILLFVSIGITEWLTYRQVENLKLGGLRSDFRNLQREAKDLVNVTKEFMLVGQQQEVFHQTDSSQILDRYQLCLGRYRDISGRTRLVLVENGYTDVGALKELDQNIDELNELFQQYLDGVRQRGIPGYGVVSEFESALIFMRQFDFRGLGKVFSDLQLESQTYLLTGDAYIKGFAQQQMTTFQQEAPTFMDEGEISMIWSVLTEYNGNLNKLIALDTLLGTYSGFGLQGQLLNRMNTIEQNLQLEAIRQNIDDSQQATMMKVSTGLFTIFAVTLIACVLLYLVLLKRLVKPIGLLKKVVTDVSEGQLSSELPQFVVSEVDDMARSVETLTDGLQQTTHFAKSIGAGELNTEFQSLGANDILGNALLGMRDSLKNLSEEEARRNWGNEAYSQFVELLRQSTDTKALAADLLSLLVKQLGANQAALYVLDESEEGELAMDMLGCYAWNRNRHLNERVLKGEGLIGQAWIEAAPIYLTDVPQGFVNITSGLGEANPSTVFILPLVNNEKVVGILEIASFHEIEDHQKAFLHRLAESIAATISNTRTNERTQQLVEELKLSSEAMRAQEEEMRQSMEELLASQEESQRQEAHYKAEIQQLKTELRSQSG